MDLQRGSHRPYSKPRQASEIANIQPIGRLAICLPVGDDATQTILEGARARGGVERGAPAACVWEVEGEGKLMAFEHN